jgi:hypothetical protein
MNKEGFGLMTTGICISGGVVPERVVTLFIGTCCFGIVIRSLEHFNCLQKEMRVKCMKSVLDVAPPLLTSVHGNRRGKKYTRRWEFSAIRLQLTHKVFSII